MGFNSGFKGLNLSGHYEET